MGVYKIDGAELTKAYDLSNTSLEDVYDCESNRIGIGPVKEPSIFRDIAKITALSGGITANGTKQGAATDGTYIYQACGDTTENATYMNLVKYKISDGTSTVVHYDGDPSFGHANDMIYNPNNGYLYITTQSGDGRLIVVDSSDLSYVETIVVAKGDGTTNWNTWQGFYDRSNNCYWLAIGDRYHKYDTDWKYVEPSPIAISHTSGYTHQGADTDGTYIYRLVYNPSFVFVYNLSDFKYVGKIILPISGEPEGIMCDWNGNLYMTMNAGTPNIYKVRLFNT